MPDQPRTIASLFEGFSLPDKDPPTGVMAMAGVTALVGFILILLGLLGDCLETLLILLGAGLVATAAIGWTWSKREVEDGKARVEQLQSELEEWFAEQSSDNR